MATASEDGTHLFLRLGPSFAVERLQYVSVLHIDVSGALPASKLAPSCLYCLNADAKYTGYQAETRPFDDSQAKR